MSAQTLARLLRAMDTLILRRQAPGRFRIIGEPPRWCLPWCPAGAGEPVVADAAAWPTFIGHFLDEAEPFWAAGQAGELRSGAFSEQTAAGDLGSLEAVAYTVDGECILTLARLGAAHRETHRVLQLAREGQLAYAQLEQAQAALQQSEARNQDLIARLEAQQANLVAVLNQLRVGTLLLDADGAILVVNRTGGQVIGDRDEALIGRHWRDALPLGDDVRRRVERMLALPSERRTRIATPLRSARGQCYRMELDVQDDPSDARRRMLFFYDVSELHDLQRLLGEQRGDADMLGESLPMREVQREIRALAGLRTSVLIDGETGTGKELVARALHRAAGRADAPFVAVNCAGLSESLLASQLFGHRRGAFTGAVADQQGLFEAANGGTLFLDEIGDMPVSVQSSLLRVLQERELTRLGETRPRRIDVRLLAATHRDLADEVAAGRFRADLLYRIRIARIRVPPLRERGDDLDRLSQAFLAELRAVIGKPIEGLGTAAAALLRRYPWPGNVRELRSAIEYAVIRCRGVVIQPEDLPPELLAERPLERPRDLQVRDEAPPVDARARLEWALARADGNRTRAARLLGISRATFYRRLAEHGMV